MPGFEDLVIYKQSLYGVKYIHNLFRHEYLKHNYDLKSQIMRASMSVCANIAEGYGRQTAKDRAQYLTISIGSVNEVVAFLDIVGTLYPKIQVKEQREHYKILCKQIHAFRTSLLK